LKHLLFRWIGSTLALIATVYLAGWLGLPLKFAATSHAGLVLSAFEAALVIGLVNSIVKPIITLVALPVTILTLGLFAFVINVGMFWMTSLFVPGFQIGSILAAIFGCFTMAVLNPIINGIFGLIEEA